MDLKNKLAKIQQELKAPKGRKNRFGGFTYRSAEDIFLALKPVLAKYDVLLTVSDAVNQVGDRYYVTSTATISDADESISACGWAREQGEKKKFDDSQLTGSASSYARKYALGGLFLIDDGEDPDAVELPDDDDDEELDRQEAEDRLPFRLTLEEDSYYYVEKDNKYVMRKAGEDALLDGKKITKEEYEAGTAAPERKRRERKKR